MGFDSTRGMQGDWDAAMQGFNWGAFYFNWIWLLAHQLKLFGWGWLVAFGSPITMFILWGNGLVTGLLVTGLGGAGYAISWGLQLLISIAFGFFGNQLAMTERTWDSADDFRDCQRTWARWALICLVVSVVGSVVLALMFASFFRSVLGIK
jgi:hypothetical protein